MWGLAVQGVSGCWIDSKKEASVAPESNTNHQRP